jgi:uncharacterized protein YdeI (YjbR/CyaY-like superfamily)
MQGLNDDFYLQLFTPRNKGSTWSALNKTRIEKLATAGSIHPTGQAVIEAAKADGSWTILDAVERLEVPGDLAEALEEFNARETWDGFSRSNRKSILWWITSAKRPATRKDRVQTTARMAGKGLRAQYDKE